MDTIPHPFYMSDQQVFLAKGNSMMTLIQELYHCMGMKSQADDGVNAHKPLLELKRHNHWAAALSARQCGAVNASILLGKKQDPNKPFLTISLNTIPANIAQLQKACASSRETPNRVNHCQLSLDKCNTYNP